MTIFSGPHGNYVRGISGREVQVVQDRDQCSTGLVELGTEVENLDLVCDVEKGGRFVEQQHRGALRKRHGDPYPLTLSPTQLVHQLVCCISHSDFIQGLGDNVLVFG